MKTTLTVGGREIVVEGTVQEVLEILGQGRAATATKPHKVYGDGSSKYYQLRKNNRFCAAECGRGAARGLKTCGRRACISKIQSINSSRAMKAHWQKPEAQAHREAINAGLSRRNRELPTLAELNI